MAVDASRLACMLCEARGVLLGSVPRVAIPLVLVRCRHVILCDVQCDVDVRDPMQPDSVSFHVILGSSYCAALPHVVLGSILGADMACCRALAPTSHGRSLRVPGWPGATARAYDGVRSIIGVHDWYGESQGFGRNAPCVGYRSRYSTTDLGEASESS
ncbi:hypothetical protein B296_00017640 [Ensete ventricosum]|uniref:Uncharacterized protein n=1 Tax=Ensete ventricosum TaxID=4639 RepID=A0A426Z7N0_ENSVE|nr:hypothetical protein B296_00017640 [Ensete ventricosum]